MLISLSACSTSGGKADLDEYYALLSDFESTAKNSTESLVNVQIAYDYMNDKFMYFDAQTNIARAIYDKDNTDLAWNDYLAVYSAYLNAVDAKNATYKRLYEADVPYNALLFKKWTQEEINSLLGMHY